MESFLVYATAHAAMLCYLAALASRGAWPMAEERRRWARPVWTCGAACLAAHLAAAFQFTHHWSHAAAYEITAQRTGDLFGWHWGGGIYLNYLLVALWSLDALWWWLDAAGYEARPRWLEALWQALLALMVVNGALVFASWTGRLIFLAGGLALALLAAGIRSRQATG